MNITGALPLTKTRTDPKGVLPPGPPLPALAQTILFWSYGQRYMDTCNRCYGDIFKACVSPLGEVVVISDPKEIKRVFTGDPTALHAGEGNSFLEPLAGPHSVLLLDEREHLRARRLMLPAFHGDRVRRYEQLIIEVVERDLEGWPLGQRFELYPRMQAITLEVIMRAVMGIGDAGRRAELAKLLPRLIGIDPMMLMIWRYPKLQDVWPWSIRGRPQKKVDEILYGEIRRRISAANETEREDVLGDFLSHRDEDGQPMSEAELRDQLITLLVAGHETTAAALGWVFERLLRHPRVLAHLRESLNAGEDDYLDAVIKETLRVRPIVFQVFARKLTVPMEIGGYELPPGIKVTAAAGLVQRCARHYPDAAEFRPERFFEEGTPSPYTWIPFGGGSRRCLGAPFATFEMKVVIRTVLRNMQLRACTQPPERVRPRHPTQIPARGAEAILVRRLRTAAT